MDWRDTFSLAHIRYKVSLFALVPDVQKHVNRTRIDQMVLDRKSILDPTPLSPQGASSQRITKQSSSPPGDIGSNGHAAVRENGDKARQRQHKSLLITNSPSGLNGVRSNKASSESDWIRPANSHEKSHDMQLECNPLLQEVALGLSQLASILRTGKIPEAEVEFLPKVMCYLPCCCSTPRGLLCHMLEDRYGADKSVC